jgi:hypothetical protein
MQPTSVQIAEQRPDASVKTRRTERLTIALLIAAIVLSFLPRLSGPIDMRWDAATYYVLGTSLAQGNGYRLVSEPGDILETQYPPLVPLMIALHQKVLGTADYIVVGQWLKLTWLLLLIAFVIGTYFWLKRFLPRGWALGGAGLCVLNHHLYFQSSQCSADLPFAVASIVFLLLATTRDPRPAKSVAAGAVAAAAFFIRTVGIAIFAAWVGDAVLRKQWRSAAVRCAVAFACVMSWQLYIRSVESSPEYAKPAYAYQRAGYLFYNVSYARNMAYRDPFMPELGMATTGDMVRRVATNVILVPVSLAGTITSAKDFWRSQGAFINRKTGLEIPFDPFIECLLFAFGIVILGGLVLLALQRQWLVTIYTAVSVLAVISTPWPGQMIRYLAPLTPCLLLAAAVAVRRLPFVDVPGRGKRWNRALLAILGVLVLEQTATWVESHWGYTRPGHAMHPTIGRVDFRHLFYGTSEIGFDESLSWIAARAEQSDVLAASLPQRMYIMTGLKAVMPPFEVDPTKAAALLDSVPVRFLLLERGTVPPNFAYRYIDGAVRTYPDRWRLVYTATQGDVRVYERTRL